MHLVHQIFKILEYAFLETHPICAICRSWFSNSTEIYILQPYLKFSPFVPGHISLVMGGFGAEDKDVVNHRDSPEFLLQSLFCRRLVLRLLGRVNFSDVESDSELISRINTRHRILLILEIFLLKV